MDNINQHIEQCKATYHKHYTDVFSFVQKRIQDEQATAKIVRDVFLQGFAELSNNKKSVEVSRLTQLYKIASENCESYIESGHNDRFVFINDDVSNDILDQMGTLEHRESAFRKLKNLLYNLSLKEIQLLELRFSEKRTFKEGGYIMKLSEQMTKLKTYRLLGKMRHIINL